MNAEGCSWIKKDGNGSRKSGNRIPFSMSDVIKVTFLPMHIDVPIPFVGTFFVGGISPMAFRRYLLSTYFAGV